MAHALQVADLTDQGILAELKMPLSSKRLDVLITGPNPTTKRDAAVIVELKRWTEVRSVAELVERIANGRRVIGVVSMPGDRRDEDRVAFGALAGTLFDRLYVAEPAIRGDLLVFCVANGPRTMAMLREPGASSG